MPALTTGSRDAPGAKDNNGLPRLDWQPLVESLLDDIGAGEPLERCAARFHAGLIEGLAEAVGALAGQQAMACAAAAGPTGNLAAQALRSQEPGDSVAPALLLAGGCFQNRLLLEGMIGALRRRGWQPHWGEQLPGNDGGLAAGQILALRQAGTRPAEQA